MHWKKAFKRKYLGWSLKMFLFKLKQKSCAQSAYKFQKVNQPKEKKKVCD